MTNILTRYLLRDKPRKQMKSNSLTSKELEIIRLMADGVPNKAIGGLVGLSDTTIETYRIRMIHKMKVKNSCNLVAYALRNKLIV